MKASTDSFAELVARHEREVLRACTLLLGETHLAQDAAQETFVRLWDESVRHGAPSRVTAWLRTVAAHAALDQLRRRRLRAAMTLDDGAAASPASDPLQRAAAAELHQRFEQALATLPERQRLTFRLRHEGGLPLSRVATALGVALPTAKTQFARACLKLQAALAAHREDRS